MIADGFPQLWQAFYPFSNETGAQICLAVGNALSSAGQGLAIELLYRALHGDAEASRR